MAYQFPLKNDVVFMQNYASRVNGLIERASLEAYQTGINHGFNLTSSAVIAMIANNEPITPDSLLQRVNEMQAKLEAEAMAMRAKT